MNETISKRPAAKIDPNDETVFLGVKVPCKMKQQLQTIAKKKGMRLSDLGRLILQDGIRQLKE